MYDVTDLGKKSRFLFHLAMRRQDALEYGHAEMNETCRFRDTVLLQVFRNFMGK